MPGAEQLRALRRLARTVTHYMAAVFRSRLAAVLAFSFVTLALACRDDPRNTHSAREHFRLPLFDCGVTGVRGSADAVMVHDAEGQHPGGGGASGVAAPLGRFAAGEHEACVVRESGRVDCWGDCGDSACKGPDGRFVSVAVGLDGGCGVTTDGDVACWGKAAERVARVRSGPFRSVAVDPSGFACAIRGDGGVECFGDADPAILTVPEGRFSRVAVGGGRACAIRVDGGLLCW